LTQKKRIKFTSYGRLVQKICVCHIMGCSDVSIIMTFCEKKISVVTVIETGTESVVFLATSN